MTASRRRAGVVFLAAATLATVSAALFAAGGYGVQAALFAVTAVLQFGVAAVFLHAR